MFTALKKLVSHNDNQTGNTPPGMQTMAQSLQKKFSKGVQYNMKIIIKGDRNVGKTCLFYRLQGLRFKEDYMPTQEIQATSIQWNYKATDDVVKVEVWDVVDKGKKKKRIEGLKFDNTASEQQIMEEAALDAEFVDVYKNTNGVIMMIDMTKHWTFDYVQRELPKVPPHIPVIVFANHRDMGHHRVTTEDDVRFFIEALERPPDSAPIRYMEGSMRNGFGLRFLHKFFNLPFLQLQRQTLLRQLDTNRQETELTNQELDLLQDSEEQNYELFMEVVNNTRRQLAEQLSPTASSILGDTQQSNVVLNSTSALQVDAASKSPADRMSRSKSSPSCTLPEQPPQHLQPQLQLQKQDRQYAEIASEARVTSASTIESHAAASSSPLSTSTSALSLSSSTTVPTSAPTFMSRLFKKGQAAAKESQMKEDIIDEITITDGDPIRGVDDFVPDDHLDKSFLEDDKPFKVESQVALQLDDSDSEPEGNPMVAEFQDDLDPDDSFQPALSIKSSMSQRRPSSEDVESTNAISNAVTVKVTNPTATARKVEKLPVTDDDDCLDSADDTANILAASIRLEVNGDCIEEQDYTEKIDIRDVPPVIHSLEFEDLSILETVGMSNLSSTSHLQVSRRFSGSSNAESVSDTTIGETTTMTKKKTKTSKSDKQRRDKNGDRRRDDSDCDAERRTHAKKKHRKHKVKDDERYAETKSSKRRSSSKRSSMAATIKTSDNELEDFLNDGIIKSSIRIGKTSSAGTDAANDYESL